MRDKYKVVLDTPEYRKVQELKTHLSEVKMLNLSLRVTCSSGGYFSGHHTQQKNLPSAINYRVPPICKEVKKT